MTTSCCVTSFRIIYTLQFIFWPLILQKVQKTKKCKLSGFLSNFVWWAWLSTPIWKFFLFVQHVRSSFHSFCISLVLSFFLSFCHSLFLYLWHLPLHWHFCNPEGTPRSVSPQTRSTVSWRRTVACSTWRATSPVLSGWTMSSTWTASSVKPCCAPSAAGQFLLQL